MAKYLNEFLIKQLMRVDVARFKEGACEQITLGVSKENIIRYKLLLIVYKFCRF